MPASHPEQCKYLSHQKDVHSRNEFVVRESHQSLHPVRHFLVQLQAQDVQG